MKTTYKKLFILLIGAVLFGMTSVSALELKFGAAEAGVENKVSIPVIISNPGDAILTVTGLGCDVSAESTSCELSQVNGQYNKEAKTLIGAFKDGDTVLKVTITNKSEERLTTAKVKVLYNGTSTDWSKEQKVDGMIKEKPKSTNAKLKDLYIINSKPSMSPKFSQDQLEYTVYNLPDTVQAITIGYECAEGSCDVDIEGPINVEGNKVYLNQGENEVKIKVTAEDGVSKVTYKLKVFRGETNFNSAKLKSIVLGDYELSPKFEADTKEYTATVPYSLVTLATTLSYETEDAAAVVEVKGHDNLVVGENEVKIKVTNADKSEEITYIIKVTRLDDQNIIIKSYKDGKITFIDSSNEKQELTEEEFEKKYPDEWKKIKDKTYKFDEDGNIIKDDKEDVEDSKDEKKKSKTWIIVLLIVLGIAIIGVSGFFIFKKPNDKKKNKKGNKGSDDKKDEDKKEDSEEEPKKEEDNEFKDELVEEPEEKDLLNLSDEEIDEIKIRRNPNAELDYDVESEIESVEHTAKYRSLDDTVDIDEALSDLMSTRQYRFTDEDEDK